MSDDFQYDKTIQALKECDRSEYQTNSEKAVESLTKIVEKPKKTRKFIAPLKSTPNNIQEETISTTTFSAVINESVNILNDDFFERPQDTSNFATSTTNNNADSMSMKSAGNDCVRECQNNEFSEFFNDLDLKNLNETAMMRSACHGDMGFNFYYVDYCRNNQNKDGDEDGEYLLFFLNL